jgi:hypothetical protein
MSKVIIDWRAGMDQVVNDACRQARPTDPRKRREAALVMRNPLLGYIPGNIDWVSRAVADVIEAVQRNELNGRQVIAERMIAMENGKTPT